MNRKIVSIFVIMLCGALYAQDRVIMPPVPPVGPEVAPVQPASQPVAKPAEWFEHSASATVRAGNPEAAARALIAWAEAHGGWFTAWDASSVSLRIPSRELPKLLDTLAAFGDVRDKNASVEDRTLELSELSTQIASRRKLLDNYFAMVKSASYGRVQAVEREVVNLTAEIERLEGRERFLQAQLATAQVSLFFQLRERDLPAPDGTTPFAWINRLNLTDLKEAF
jgi:hypothetical protein